MLLITLVSMLISCSFPPDQQIVNETYRKAAVESYKRDKEFPNDKKREYNELIKKRELNRYRAQIEQ